MPPWVSTAIALDMRSMNRIEPSAKPTTMPSVRSRKTTSLKVTSSTSASPQEERMSAAKAVFSTMFQATTAEHAGERRKRDVARQRRGDEDEDQQEARMQYAGDRPVRAERTLVAVRAIVPVTQMPPNSAEPMLAKPCATSSQLERCRRPVMPSATTADSSDLDRAEQGEGDGVGQHRLHGRRS